MDVDTTTVEEGSSPQEQRQQSAITALPGEELHAFEAKVTKWKEAVTVQLNSAAQKNKKLREELRLLQEEKDKALCELRVQLAEEFQERTAMQRDELATLKQQNAALQKEKILMAATHEAELQSTQAKQREVIKLEIEMEYKRREEQWEKERLQLQTQTESKENERAQVEHECDTLKLRLSKLGAQYDELAALLQSDNGATSPRCVVEQDNSVAVGTQPERASPTTPADASGTGSAAPGTTGSRAAGQRTVLATTHATQIENIKAELQNKEQHTQFLLDRARQEHEVEKAQLLRELQLRESELKVVNTLLKQLQMESNQYIARVSRAQTERQDLEQRYEAKVSALSQELAERIDAADEAQLLNKRLQEQLRTSQNQVAALEEESNIREDAFHSLMLSEDNKRVVMDLQRAVQTARDEAEKWKVQYYSSLSDSQSPLPATAAAACPSPQKPSEVKGTHKSFDPSASTDTVVRSHEAWRDQLAAKEMHLQSREAQLASKAALLEAAEAKLDKMRSTMASQAGLLLQKQSKRSGHGGGGRGGGSPHGRRDDNDGTKVFFEDSYEVGSEKEYSGRSLADASPLFSAAMSLMPSSLQSRLHMLGVQKRRLRLPGTCCLCDCCLPGDGTTGPPRLRRHDVLVMIATALIILILLSMVW